MATKVDKKNAIRQGIIEAAIVYSQSLAGKTFLYVYGDEYFEVSFPVDHFLHLTGVETILSAKDFYRNARKAILTNNQFYFDARHIYANAKKKLPCLKRLPELTNEMVCGTKTQAPWRSSGGNERETYYFKGSRRTGKYSPRKWRDFAVTV